MTDEQQARAALAEVDRRRDEVARMSVREVAPPWFLAVAAAVLVATALVSDLRTQIPDWNGWFTRWAVPVLGLLVMAVCLLVVHRRATVTAHRSVTRRRTTTLGVGVIACYVVAMVIGIPMRLHRIPFDQTVSTVGAAVLVVAGWLVYRHVRNSRS